MRENCSRKNFYILHKILNNVKFLRGYFVEELKKKLQDINRLATLRAHEKKRDFLSTCHFIITYANFN